MGLLLVMTFVFRDAGAALAVPRDPHADLASWKASRASIAEGDLQARVDKPEVTELHGLTESLNVMAVKLQQLIDENRREQENLKRSELRTLQAQITPHFLYNTLDAIVWLAEAAAHGGGDPHHRALSDFFRISLSTGAGLDPACPTRSSICRVT